MQRHREGQRSVEGHTAGYRYLNLSHSKHRLKSPTSLSVVTNWGKKPPSHSLFLERLSWAADG